MLPPLLVHAGEDDDGYELVDGERRYRAALRAGLSEVPVLVHPRATDGDDLVSALTASFHRAAHTPVEEARAFARLLDAGLTRNEFAATIDHVARRSSMAWTDDPE